MDRRRVVRLHALAWLPERALDAAPRGALPAQARLQGHLRRGHNPLGPLRRALRMRLMRMIGLGLTAYSAYKMLKGSTGGMRGTAPRASYSPAPRMGSSTRPGIDLLKRRRGAL